MAIPDELHCNRNPSQHQALGPCCAKAACLHEKKQSCPKILIATPIQSNKFSHTNGGRKEKSLEAENFFLHAILAAKPQTSVSPSSALSS